MRFNINVAMHYQLCQDEAVLLAIEAAQTDGQTIVESTLDIADASQSRIEPEAQVGQRLWALVRGDKLNLKYHAVVDVTRTRTDIASLAPTPMHLLPAESLAYLQPSRFCQSDLLTGFVDAKFGNLDGGAKIAAISDWVGREIVYRSGSSNGSTTATDTFLTRAGVCRDFAHLVCAMARAANIPARYASVYGPDVTPQDFHAVADVWLDGAWHFVDPTGMSQPDQLVVIGAGRDAADVAFMETPRWASVISQNVNVTQA